VVDRIEECVGLNRILEQQCSSSHKELSVDDFRF
jgi:hypothetical protein